MQFRQRLFEGYRAFLDGRLAREQDRTSQCGRCGDFRDLQG